MLLFKSSDKFDVPGAAADDEAQRDADEKAGGRRA